MDLPESLNKVVKHLKRLPGIGEKSAIRQSLVIAKWDSSDLIDFASAIDSLKKLKKCQECGIYSDQELCEICRNPHRKDSGVICVVESITDCLAIERGHQFLGRYFILNGVLNPLLGVTPDDLQIGKLISIIKKYEIKEVILAVNPSVEGDATCSYIKDVVPKEIVVERIGLGIPVGGSLEYLDGATILKAIENRRKF